VAGLAGARLWHPLRGGIGSATNHDGSCLPPRP